MRNPAPRHPAILSVRRRKGLLSRPSLRTTRSVLLIPGTSFCDRLLGGLALRRFSLISSSAEPSQEGISRPGRTDPDPGCHGLYAFVGVRYRLGVGDWVFAAIALVLLAGYALVASVLLRQPGVALPGLMGGLLVALTWLVLSGHTFYDVINLVTSPLATTGLVIVLPVLVGVAGTLWSGSAAAGRRIARLAGISAGLCITLYGTIAVVALGTGGPPGDPGCTGSCLIADRLGTNTIFYLWLLPLTTAALGWSAAAATARIRPRLAATAGAVPVTTAGRVGARRHRTALVVLLSAVAAASLVLIAAGFLRG